VRAVGEADAQSAALVDIDRRDPSGLLVTGPIHVPR
jgi:hypothetical protein